MKFRKQKRWRWLASAIGSWAIWLVGLTVRARFEDPTELEANQESRGNYIFAFWHNRLFLLPYFYRKFRRGFRMVALISASGDGEVIAQIANRFGVQAARGSTSREGGTAFRAMLRAVEDGFDAGVTPDGPRGPRGVVQLGALRLAQRTGRPLVPLSLSYSAKWELRSWDRFQIPQPFARCTIQLREPITVPPDLDDAGLEKLALELAESIGE